MDCDEPAGFGSITESSTLTEISCTGFELEKTSVFDSEVVGDSQTTICALIFLKFRGECIFKSLENSMTRFESPVNCDIQDKKLENFELLLERKNSNRGFFNHSFTCEKGVKGNFCTDY